MGVECDQIVHVQCQSILKKYVAQFMIDLTVVDAHFDSLGLGVHATLRTTSHQCRLNVITLMRGRGGGWGGGGEVCEIEVRVWLKEVQEVSQSQTIVYL